MDKFKVELTIAELDIIGQALGKLPLEQSMNVFVNLQNQFAAIQAKKNADPKDKNADPKAK